MAVIPLNEGQSEPYSIIAPFGTYAVANWSIVAGDAQLGFDFDVDPLSGINVTVNQGQTIEIDFNIIDDTIPEGIESFTFFVEITHYDFVTGEIVNYYRDQHTIAIQDNDAACFIDLAGDGSQDLVDFTFQEASTALSNSVQDLKDVGDQLKLANQLLEAQLDQQAALEDLARLGIIDAILSPLTLGVPNLGKFLAVDVPKFVEALSNSTALYNGTVNEQIGALISLGADLAKGLVKGAPFIGLLASTYDQFKSLDDIWTEANALVPRIKDTEASIVALQTKFDDLKTNIEKLSTCFTGPLMLSDGSDIDQSSVAAITTITPVFFGNEIKIPELGYSQITGGDFNDSFVVGDDSEIAIQIVQAGGGDDVISVFARGSDGLIVVSGGMGKDVLEVTDLLASDALWLLDSGGYLALTPKTENIGIGAQMILEGIERIEFADRHVAFDIDGNSGQAYRLYQAAFDRVPDTVGLGYWISELDSGKSDLPLISLSFIRSAEFQATYGNPGTVSDAQFVTLIYQNVLDRAPDQAGLNHWLNDLSNGYRREDLLTFFSESAENKANVIGAIDNGIEFVPWA